MSTHDVPGSNPANADVLAAGCWAEHSDGSLIYVKGTEGGQIVYELYDVIQNPPVYYQDCMLEESFKRTFSWKKPGDIEWTWHDKTPFPWSRVMKTIERPIPQHADVNEMLSAAGRVVQSLKLRARKLRRYDIEQNITEGESRGRKIVERIRDAFEALVR